MMPKFGTIKTNIVLDDLNEFLIVIIIVFFFEADMKKLEADCIFFFSYLFLE